MIKQKQKILLEILLLRLFATQHGYPRVVESAKAVAEIEKILLSTNLSKSKKRRHGKKIKLASEILKCSRQTIYHMLLTKGPMALAARLEAAGRPDIAALFMAESEAGK